VEREVPVLGYPDDDSVDAGGKKLPEDARIDLLVTSHTSTVMIDVSVIHPRAEMNRKLDIKDSGAAIAERAKKKMNYYGRAAKAMDAELIPFVVDAYGRLGNTAILWLQTLAEEAEAHGHYNSEEEFKDDAYSIISTSIQKGNAASIIRTLQSIRRYHIYSNRPQVGADRAHPRASNRAGAAEDDA
jgi:hypothetical protein